MTPDATAIAAVTAMLQVLSGWKAWGVLVAIVMGPWVCHLIIQNRTTERIDTLKDQLAATDANIKERFVRTVRNYEDNVVLVQNYQQLAETLTQTIKRNTEVITRLNDRIDGRRSGPRSTSDE